MQSRPHEGRFPHPIEDAAAVANTVEVSVAHAVLANVFDDAARCAIAYLERRAKAELLEGAKNPRRSHRGEDALAPHGMNGAREGLRRVL